MVFYRLETSFPARLASRTILEEQVFLASILFSEQQQDQIPDGAAVPLST